MITEPQLKTQWLEHFVLICQAQGVRSAAELSGISRQTLQRSLDQLEAQQQTPLLQRGKDFRLTQSGLLFWQQAREMTQALQVLEQRLLVLGPHLSGSVAFAWQSATSLDFLPAALADFMSVHPDVYLNIQCEPQTATLCERLARHQLDLAVMDLCPPGDGFVVQTGRRSPFVIVSAPRATCHWSELDYAVPYSAGPQPRKPRWDEQAHPRRIVCTTDSLDVLLDWALTGRAATFLPQITVQGLLDQGKLAIVAQPPAPAYKELYLASTSAALEKSAVKALQLALYQVMQT